MRIAFIAHDLREPFKDYDTPTPYFNPGIEALLEGFKALPGLEIHMVCCTQKPVKAPKKLAERIWFHSLHVPKLGWLRTGYQGCIRATRRKIKEIRPDIAHGYGTERDCGLSAFFSGVPSLVTIQGNMAELARLNRARFGSYGWWAARLENFTLARVNGVICNSIYTQKLVAGRSEKMWVTYPALRPQFLESAPVVPKRCIILNVGVISPRKRQLELLAVAERLHKEGLQFQFHFLGRADTSDYARQFQQRIAQLETTGCVRYLGRVSDTELLQHYDTAAGMIHFSSEEAFGLNVAEALARNLKIFGSRTGGIVEICDDVPEAELFAPDDWNGLTRAIARWIRQGHPLLKDAATIMRQRYNPETIARQHLDIYREVLAGRRP